MLELREQMPPEPAARCTFCRKGSDEVYVVQLGSICEECSDLGSEPTKSIASCGHGRRASNGPLMPPLKRDHMVSGPHTLKGGKLTFRTAGALLAQDAKRAQTSGREFTVSLSEPDKLTEMTGKVQTVELVDGMKPAQWEIVMRV